MAVPAHAVHHLPVAEAAVGVGVKVHIETPF
jgi:hypothetical protein